MMKICIFPLWIMAFLPLLAQAEIHKCVIDGKFIYTDQKCPGESAVTFTPSDIITIAAENVSYTGSVWLKDNSGYTQAIKVGLRENLPVLIYGYTDWCGFCKKLEENYFDNDDMKKVLAGFIKVKINPEHSRKDDELYKRIGGRGYPMLFVQHPNLPLQRIDDPFIRLKNGQRSEIAPAIYHKAFLPHLAPYKKTLAHE